MAIVSIENISKTYPAPKKNSAAQKAIDDISFTVNDKEFMVIVGPSGCGKSTLLRMIAGLETIGEGNLLIDGKRVNDLDPRDRDIAMVFQNYALYPHMTVYDNMAFGLKLKRFNKSEIKERVLQTAALLDMESVLDRKPSTLSGGQRQRVAIGRAIIRRPKVFLFDEPLSNLDAKLRSQMRIELQKLHREINATMIYVTHDQTEAMTLGNRIAVLSKGKLMQLDTPLHLYNKPQNKFVAGFIGSPAMNFINGTIIKDDDYIFVSAGGDYRVSLGDKFVSKPENLVGQQIQIGIRPEHIVLCRENDSKSIPDCTMEITAYENMGNEQLVYLSGNNQVLIVRGETDDTTMPGSSKEISFMRNKMIFINEASGQVID